MRFANHDLDPVVVDSNNLISAMLFPRSVPGQALDVILRNGRLVFSQETLVEIAEVIGRDKFDRYVDQADRVDFVQKITRSALWIEVTENITACRDSKDNKFLSLALAADARIILTGDEDLLVLDPFRGVHILTPRDFLAA